MLNAMKDAKSFLDELGITSWLDCGTLLFMYRDHKPDMSDCDMAIYEKDMLKLINNLERFLNNGFRLYKIYTHPIKGVTEVSLYYGTHKVDIFTKFYQDDLAYMIATKPDKTYLVSKYPKRHFYPLTLFTLDENISIGEPFYWRIPNDVESYLETYYGKDWRIPAKNWDWTKDAPCIDLKWEIK